MLNLGSGKFIFPENLTHELGTSSLPDVNLILNNEDYGYKSDFIKYGSLSEYLAVNDLTYSEGINSFKKLGKDNIFFLIYCNKEDYLDCYFTYLINKLPNCSDEIFYRLYCHIVTWIYVCIPYGYFSNDFKTVKNKQKYYRSFSPRYRMDYKRFIDFLNNLRLNTEAITLPRATELEIANYYLTEEITVNLKEEMFIQNIGEFTGSIKGVFFLYNFYNKKDEIEKGVLDFSEFIFKIGDREKEYRAVLNTDVSLIRKTLIAASKFNSDGYPGSIEIIKEVDADNTRDYVINYGLYDIRKDLVKKKDTFFFTKKDFIFNNYIALDILNNRENDQYLFNFSE